MKVKVFKGHFFEKNVIKQCFYKKDKLKMRQIWSGWLRLLKHSD